MLGACAFLPANLTSEGYVAFAAPEAAPETAPRAFAAAPAIWPKPLLTAVPSTVAEAAAAPPIREVDDRPYPPEARAAAEVMALTTSAGDFNITTFGCVSRTPFSVTVPGRVVTRTPCPYKLLAASAAFLPTPTVARPASPAVPFAVAVANDAVPLTATRLTRLVPPVNKDVPMSNASIPASSDAPVHHSVTASESKAESPWPIALPIIAVFMPISWTYSATDAE